MAETYGMPRGSNSGGYGGGGVRFPDWVYQLGNAFGIKPSTYPGHQENDRIEAGYARNPDRLNRGIDWAAPGAPDQWDRLTRFADYLATIPQHLEQVIWQNPNTMRSIEVAGGRHQPGYFRADLAGHRDHVHTRQSKPIPLPLPGGTPPATPAPSNQVDVLARATGVSTEKATEILIGVVNGLRDSQCTNVNRIAMWLAQMGHESAGFNATEEYATGDAYEGRRDLGNTQPGDGRRFKGRSWIQITGRSNYTALSKWAHGKGIVPAPDYFVTDSTRLGRIEYAGLGPSWYWTVARPDINELSDRRDLDTVTRRINGGLNGIADRRSRYNRALALGDQLLTLTTPAPPAGGLFMTLSASEEREVLNAARELTKRFPSRSPLRHLGEGLVDSAAGFILNTDGHGHVQLVKTLAELGHPDSLALLREVAAADPVKYPDRQADKLVAQAILADITAPPKPVADSSSAPVAAPAPAPQVTAVVDTAELRAAYEEIARLREDNARLRAAVDAQPAPATINVNGVVERAQTSGDIAGRVFDSVEDWTEHVLSMDTKQRAAFGTSLKALELPNGAAQ